ncbi:hypothetical protein [Phenylobacterium sp.]|uniref:hypothetical protein n=1 Tax=Phenylobacterium sp. TaxID=1871053 RepID=UPI00273148F8|nr:hypothetical protein [Phenylobacterium sp.]MDP1872689.1 hypothetical protein [Phenylobacterium sp.]MDP3490791.1 hypothetical protein [Phenylobacterium sp.]
MNDQDAKRHTPVQNPPPEAPVQSQEEQVERTGRAPEVTGQTEELPKDTGERDKP